MKKVMRSAVPLLSVLMMTPVLANAGVEVPEVGESAFSMFQPGVEIKARLLRNGQEVLRTSKLVGDTIERSDSNGCSFTFKAEDVYSPNLTWNNCSPGPWGTGHVENLRKDGQLWPLKVGNVAHYKFTTVNSEGKKNIFAFRSCEVTEKVMVSAAGKDYPAYKTHCTEHNGTRTFYYAPSVEATVRVEQEHKKNGLTVVEFIERLP